MERINCNQAQTKRTKTHKLNHLIENDHLEVGLQHSKLAKRVESQNGIDKTVAAKSGSGSRLHSQNGLCFICMDTNLAFRVQLEIADPKGLENKEFCRQRRDGNSDRTNLTVISLQTAIHSD